MTQEVAIVIHVIVIRNVQNVNTFMQVTDSDVGPLWHAFFGLKNYFLFFLSGNKW